MEYCPGGDLNQLIKRCKQQKQYINEDIIWKIFSQVVSALYACHTNKSGKILHRDIKPSNIFLDNENNVKLGDFGLSLMLNNEMNFAYSNVGTPYYMSPEQVDENKYNEKSDIWSLGCFLYELTTLHPPFEAHNHLSLALKIKSGKIERIPDKYSHNLSKVIFWMINIDPNKRPSIKDIISIPEVNIRIKEKKVKDGYQKLKKYENELKLKEENLIETEKKLIIKEQFLDEREKNIIQRENYIKMKEEEINNNSKENNYNYKYKNNKKLFITSNGFDIKGLDYSTEENINKKDYNYDSKFNSIKNGHKTNFKKYYSNKPKRKSKDDLLPINIDKKYSNTIRKSSMDEEKMQYEYENNKNQTKDNSSFYSLKLKTNIDLNSNNNNLKNLLANHYNTSKNNINSINFNNNNNIDNNSKVISFNSELNYSSNDEKYIKNNNNINTSNINNLGLLSINSQENNNMMNNNSYNNINNNNSIRKSNNYKNKNSFNKNTNHKNSFVENNLDYKSGSTNYFSSIPRTSGESYKENIISNEVD